MRARLLSGTIGDLKGPFETVTQTQIVDYMLDVSSTHQHDLPVNLDNCLVYVYKGSGFVNDTPISMYQIAHLDATSVSRRSLSLRTDASNELAVIIFSGKKLNEPIAWHGKN